jgi:glyoxylate carboligase
MQTESSSTRNKLPELDDHLAGYHVEGRDGRIGKVDRVTYDRTCLIVHTGRVVGGNHVVPALAVQSINGGTKQVIVDLTADEVRAAPKFDDHAGYDEDCQSRAEAYYGPVLQNRLSQEPFGSKNPEISG